jgi:uncharacterized peroxidase-related enzyme
MSYFRSLKAEAGLLQIFQAFPEIARPLLEYHEVLLRGKSPFSTAEREFIAAYVSGLNNCNYCHAVHSQTAITLGVGAETVARMYSDARNEHVDPRMQPVLAFVKKLTLAPGTVAAADTEPILAAGWDDRALHDAAAICGLFNLMNRLVNGLGVEASETYIRIAAQRLADKGYAYLTDFLPSPSQ